MEELQQQPITSPADINFDENDEVSDEVYFYDEETEKQQEEQKNHEDEQNGIASDFEDPLTAPISDIPEMEDYCVSSISESFLRSECQIQLESSKTKVKFEYRGEYYCGVVLKKLPTAKRDYVLLVQKANSKGVAEKTADKFLKKFHAPEIIML